MRFRRICRYAFAALTASMAGCASSPGRPSPGTGRERVSVQTTQVNYDIPLTVDARETKAVLEMRADTVWRAVPLAYAAMSIPTELVDPAHRLFVGNARARVRFNGQPVSKFVDCGSGLTGPNADTYSVQFRIQTQVDSVAPGQSNVRTQLEASGVSSAGGQVRCATTGELERQLSVRVKLIAFGQEDASP
jgi:hypothetical protein